MEITGRTHRFIRKSHRYLGLVLGIQFFAWTLGGLYFSWTNIEHIRGDDLKAEKKNLPIVAYNASLSVLLDSLQKADPKLQFHAIQVIDILGKAYYQIQVENSSKKNYLFDMQTLSPKQPMGQAEAEKIATSSLKNPSLIVHTTYLTNTNGHHEYRGKPMPAYAVTFAKPNNTTVYVSTELGTVQSFRNNKWRVFDFLWMLHTMDYANRDNINNWLLRLFSIFGLMTISSGFLLYIISSRINILKNK